jgi:hypothetical protein
VLTPSEAAIDRLLILDPGNIAPAINARLSDA